MALPLFTPRLQTDAPSVALARLEQQLSDLVRWVICAPECNGSIPLVFTSAIPWLSVKGSDFLSRFNGRPVVLRLVLAHLGAVVVGRQLGSNSTTPAKVASISDLITRLIALSDPPACSAEDSVRSILLAAPASP